MAEDNPEFELTINYAPSTKTKGGLLPAEQTEKFKQKQEQDKIKKRLEKVEEAVTLQKFMVEKGIKNVEKDVRKIKEEGYAGRPREQVFTGSTVPKFRRVLDRTEAGFKKILQGELDRRNPPAVLKEKPKHYKPIDNAKLHKATQRAEMVRGKQITIDPSLLAGAEGLYTKIATPVNAETLAKRKRKARKRLATAEKAYERAIISGNPAKIRLAEARLEEITDVEPQVLTDTKLVASQNAEKKLAEKEKTAQTKLEKSWGKQREWENKQFTKNQQQADWSAYAALQQNDRQGQAAFDKKTKADMALFKKQIGWQNQLKKQRDKANAKSWAKQIKWENKQHKKRQNYQLVQFGKSLRKVHAANRRRDAQTLKLIAKAMQSGDLQDAMNPKWYSGFTKGFASANRALDRSRTLSQRLKTRGVYHIAAGFLNPERTTGKVALNLMAMMGPKGALLASAITIILSSPEVIRAFIKVFGRKGGPINRDWRRLIEEETTGMLSLEEQKRRDLGLDGFIVSPDVGFKPVDESSVYNSVLLRDEIRLNKLSQGEKVQTSR